MIPISAFSEVCPEMKRPGIFRPWQPSTAPKITVSEGFRGSPRERGYSARWDRLSLAYRRANPFCAEAVRCGHDDVMADLVDHILPAADFPHLRLEWSNLQSASRIFHGRKTALEEYARRTGQMMLLPQWMQHPETRPPQFMDLGYGTPPRA